MNNWENQIKSYIDFKSIEDRDVCLNWVKTLLQEEREWFKDRIKAKMHRPTCGCWNCPKDGARMLKIKEMLLEEISDR